MVNTSADVCASPFCCGAHVARAITVSALGMPAGTTNTGACFMHGGEEITVEAVEAYTSYPDKDTHDSDSMAEAAW